MLDHIAFAYHFYGHTGEDYYQKLTDNGITCSIKIKELEFNAKGKLEQGDDIHIKPESLFDIIHFDKVSWHSL